MALGSGADPEIILIIPGDLVNLPRIINICEIVIKYRIIFITGIVIEIFSTSLHANSISMSSRSIQFFFTFDRQHDNTGRLRKRLSVIVVQLWIFTLLVVEHLFSAVALDTVE